MLSAINAAMNIKSWGLRELGTELNKAILDSQPTGSAVRLNKKRRAKPKQLDPAPSRVAPAGQRVHAGEDVNV